VGCPRLALTPWDIEAEDPYLSPAQRQRRDADIAKDQQKPLREKFEEMKRDDVERFKWLHKHTKLRRKTGDPDARVWSQSEYDKHYPRGKSVTIELIIEKNDPS
jgi:hypothetical protein